MPLANPLTPPERRRAVALVAAADSDLADRLDAELAGDGDPLVAALQGALEASATSSTKRMDDIVTAFRETGARLEAEVRAVRLQVVGLVALALVLQTLLVGGSVVFSGFGVSLSTSANAATSSAEVDVEDVDPSTWPAPAPTDAPQ